jgi:hypothetical protein
VVGEKTPWGNFSTKISAVGEVLIILEDSGPLLFFLL